MQRRLIIGVTGASGSIYATTLTKVLASMDWLDQFGIDNKLFRRWDGAKC